MNAAACMAPIASRWILRMIIRFYFPSHPSIQTSIQTSTYPSISIIPSNPQRHPNHLPQNHPKHPPHLLQLPLLIFIHKLLIPSHTLLRRCVNLSLDSAMLPLDDAADVRDGRGGGGPMEGAYGGIGCVPCGAVGGGVVRAGVGNVRVRGGG